MRLDKYLSNALNVSRKESRDYIKDGFIKVNGKKILNKEYKIEEQQDEVFFKDEKLEYKEFIYYMLNKPQGYLSACVDKNDKVVVDLFPANIRNKIFPIGRLDKDTEGLLLLTNNGSLCHKITSPMSDVFKVYYVETKEKVDKKAIKMFEDGMVIKNGKGEPFMTKKAILSIFEDHSLVTISEGKFHQVKEMFKKIDNEVTYLKRIKIGHIDLDESLGLGEYRELNEEEVKSLFEILDKSVK